MSIQRDMAEAGDATATIELAAAEAQDRAEKAEKALAELQNGPDTLTPDGLRIVNRALSTARLDQAAQEMGE